jgi:hypothetical protein
MSCSHCIALCLILLRYSFKYSQIGSSTNAKIILLWTYSHCKDIDINAQGKQSDSTVFYFCLSYEIEMEYKVVF